MALTCPQATGASVALIPGGRLHLQHGPIDIVAEAFGPPAAVRAAYARAVLPELGGERAVTVRPYTGQRPAATSAATPAAAGASR